jgi:hypothetical protein
VKHLRFVTVVIIEKGGIIIPEKSNIVFYLKKIIWPEVGIKMFFKE